MYKFTEKLWDSKGLLISIRLKTKQWRVDMREVDGHVHVTIHGPNGYRKQGLSSIKTGLTKFELKVTALHFYRLARDHDNRVHRHSYIEFVNYADIFGSCFD